MVKFLIREGSNKSLYNFGLRVVRNREEYEFHVSLIVSYIYIYKIHWNTIPWSVKFYAVSLSIVGSRVERSGDRAVRRCGNNRQTGNMSVGFRPGYKSR